MNKERIQLILDRGITGCLFLLAFAAPLSIAATQFAWAVGLFLWIIRAFVVRPMPRKGPMELAILAFVGLTIVSSAFSYEPEVSIRKLVGVSLVTIVYLVAEFIGGLGNIRKAVVVVLAAGVISVIFTLGVLAVGKNLKVNTLAPDSVLRTAGVLEGDTILIVNGESVASPNDLIRAAGKTAAGDAKFTLYRHEFIVDGLLPAALIKPGTDDAERLGIVSWSRGRDTRAQGFFGHYTTYAEALQLIASLAMGLLIVFPGRLFDGNRLLIAGTLGLLCLALFLTLTRASWAGFALSAAVMIVVGASRRTVLICVLCAIPLAAGGLYYLQQKRNVAFVDSSDASTTWRMTVWREGFGVLTSSPRHLLVGVGMDSIKKHYLDWHMFDNGKLPIGHLHSTPLQFAFERGVPTLIAWIVWMFFYLKLLWRGLHRADLEWPERGLLLGAYGGAIGFLAGGIVHYNWGDSEVVMIFYLLMGLSLAVLGSGSEREAEIA